MQVLTYDKAHTSTTQLFPSVARTAELVASQPGIWQYNCDVQDHLVAGMTRSVRPVIVQRVCCCTFCSAAAALTVLCIVGAQECKPDS